MARLEWSRRALADLDRLHGFLHPKNPRAADAAFDALLAATGELAAFPLLGRPLREADGTRRELIVRFSNSGYLILYRYEDDTVVILGVRHQSEAGY